MYTTPKTQPQANAMPPIPVVREYDIGGYKYIVNAKAKTGAKEDAAAIVRRLIRKEITRNAAK